jgi:hypothetical protein
MVPKCIHLITFLSLTISWVVALTVDGIGRPCGLKIGACFSTQTCRYKPDCNDPNTCTGRCYQALKNRSPAASEKFLLESTSVDANTWVLPRYQSCGGHRVKSSSCERGHVCVDDPRLIGCGLKCGMPGICVPSTGGTCKGIKEGTCPPGQKCYDIPSDGCDPINGGSDCPSICLYQLLPPTWTIAENTNGEQEQEQATD